MLPPCPPGSCDHFALCPQKRGGLLGTGTKGKRAREWRLDRGYRPKKTGETVDCRQNNGSVKAVSPRHCAATGALRNCCYNVRCTAVEEQPEAKEVQLSQPSSTSLLMISSGLTWGSSSTSLLLISPGTLNRWMSCQRIALVIVFIKIKIKIKTSLVHLQHWELLGLWTNPSSASFPPWRTVFYQLCHLL